MVLGAHIGIAWEVDFLKKNNFAPKMGEMGQKKCFLNLLKNLFIKVDIICYIPV